MVQVAIPFSEALLTIGCLWGPEEALDRDNFKSSTEALDFGLIDEVIEKRSDVVSEE